MESFNKELCDCGRIATWCYLPGYLDEDANDYNCDECVPRGCSCNSHYLIEEGESLPDKDEKNVKYLDKEGNEVDREVAVYWEDTDEGKLFPCCEHNYSKDGFEEESKEKS